MSLAARDQQVIWHPYTQMQLAKAPIAIVKGEGAMLYDEAGGTYIDAISSWWVNLHGHAHPYITKKVSAQLKKLEHVIFADFTHQPAIELAESLLNILPDNQTKIFYSDNGSTAVEVAIKMAIQFWHNQGKSKNKIIVFEHSYHGDTFGAMSVSARTAFTAPYGQLLFDVITIPLPKHDKEEECIAVFKKAIQTNAGEIAAFIFEPLLLGTAGMLTYNANTLDTLLTLCKENQILSIADEVMTGFYRTGKFFACDYLKTQPDIFCLSKGLTGGTMALGVTSCSENIYEAFLSDNKLKTFFHGHSFTANPLACTAAMASLQLLKEDACLQNIKNIVHSQQQFANTLSNSKKIKNIRQIGTVLAFDVLSQDSENYFNTDRDKLYHFFLSEGVLIRPLGNTVYTMPPYCITDAQLLNIQEVIEKIL